MLILSWVLSLTLLTTACGGGGGNNLNQGDSNQSQEQGQTPSNDDGAPPEVFVRPDLTGSASARPEETWEAIAEAGVQVHTFNQTVDERQILRRFLFYVPEGLEADQSYPLVIGLHGANISAEIYRQFDSVGDLERLADEHQFIVVYGNAISPNVDPDSDPFLAHRGLWMSDSVATDVNYLLAIETELANLGFRLDFEAIFITGVSNGGQMSYEAGLANPSHYKAIAPVIPAIFSVRVPDQPLSMMLVYSAADPFFPTNYATTMESMVSAWGQAIGVNEADLTNVTRQFLPDQVVEGEGYSGTVAAALNTTNSRIAVREYSSQNGDYWLWVYDSERGGHGMPHPVQFEVESTVEAVGTGFRNQDMNTLIEMWRFFSLHL